MPRRIILFAVIVAVLVGLAIAGKPMMRLATPSKAMRAANELVATAKSQEAAANAAYQAAQYREFNTTCPKDDLGRDTCLMDTRRTVSQFDESYAALQRVTASRQTVFEAVAAQRAHDRTQVETGVAVAVLAILAGAIGFWLFKPE